MPEAYLEVPEEQSVVRLHNRALRSVNRGLRRQVERLKTHSDDLFIALCDTDVAAVQAMRRLWEEGGFQPPCGPEDYQEIVDVSIRALRAYRDTASAPAQSTVAATDPDWQQP